MAAKKIPTKREARPAMTVAQLQATMAETKPGFDAYERARLALKKGGHTAAAEKKLEAAMEKRRAEFTVYWRCFNDPKMRAQRDRARAAKPAAASRPSTA